VNTGQEAVARVAAAPEIDLVLIDILLGTEMDGIQSARLILQQRHLPVIFLSGYSGPDLIAKIETVDSYGFVSKNAGEAALIMSIRAALRLFEARQKEQESEELYRQMFTGYTALMALIDPESGAIVDANPAASQFYGYPIETLRQMNINQINTLTPEELAQAYQEAKERRLTFF
jgi:CheY-like chemotaxis protein